LTEGLKEGEETSDEVSLVAVAVEMRQVVLRVQRRQDQALVC
jgi:hypothetical protein